MTQVNTMPNPKGNIATLKHYTAKWKSGSTHTIRVPTVLADTILEYAHQLDDNSLTQANQNGNSDNGTTVDEDQGVKLREALTQVINTLEQICKTPNTSKFTKAIKARIQAEAIEKLKALTQVNKEDYLDS